jgi:DNA-binding MarR family transcriptional regulator
MRRARQPDVDESATLPALGDALEFMRLIWAIDHGLQKASKRLAASAGVTGPQRLVVYIVGRFPGISAGQLSSTLHVHPSTLTGVLRRLERRGLLSRRPDPRDARRAALGLTPKGRRLDLAVAGPVESAVQQVLRDLPRDKGCVAREVLAMLARRLGVECDRAASRQDGRPRRGAC